MNARKNPKAVVVTLFLLLLCSYAYFINPPSSELFNSNETVRFLLTKSIVLDRSVTIGKYSTVGVDMALHNGDYFSGKAPGLSLVSVPFYALAVSAVGRDLPDGIALYLLRFITISLPTALFIIIALRLVERIGPPQGLGRLLLIGYGLGTLVFAYSILFLGHQPGAILCFCSLLVILRWSRGGKRNAALASLAGLLGGLAVAFEYPVAVLVLIIAIFAFYPYRHIGQIGCFILGLLPGAVIVLGYNWICFGDPLSFPYAHEAMPIAREVQSQGLFGLKTPKLIPFLKLLFSPFRGLFFVSPFLVFAIAGYFYMFKRTENDDLQSSVGMSRKRLLGLSLTAVLCYILLNSSYLAWSGGAAYGPRHLIPAIPFFLIPIAYLFRARPRAYLPFAIIFVIYSVLFNLIGVSGGPIAHEYLRNPVRDAALLYVITGNIYPNWGSLLGIHGLASLIPLGLIWLILLVVIFRSGYGLWGEKDRKALGLTGHLLRIFIWLLAAAMVALFFIHRTEGTAYRYAVIGHGFNIRGDSTRAEKYFEQSLRLNPNDPLVLQDYSMLAIRRGDYRLALELNMRLLKLTTAQRALLKRMETLLRLTEVKERLEAKPNDPGLLLERQTLLESLGVQSSS